MAWSYLLSVAAFGALLAAPARADEYSPYGPPPARFAGAEVGGQLGAAIGGSGDVSSSGFGGGVYGGYHLQNGPIVGGLEADTVLASISGDGRGGTISQNWLTSVRVRGGWAFGNILAYGTIGPAFASSSFERNGFTYDKGLHGYTFGLGGEVAINSLIDARAEFRHYEFSGATYYVPAGVQKISSGNNLLLVGLGAHF